MPTIADFKAATDTVDVAERLGLEVRRRGANGTVRCPVHEDRSPSCSLRPQGWKCFSCGAGGSAIDLVMAVRSCTFGEAVDWIAEATGIARPERDPRAERRSAALRLLREAARDGLERAYLAKQPLSLGLEAEEAVRLGVGILPDPLPELPDSLLTAGEAAAFAGAISVELHGRGGMAAMAAFDTASGELIVPKALRFPAFVALGAAREAIARHEAAILAPDAGTALRLQAAGNGAAIAAPGPLTPETAAALGEIARRVIIAAAPGTDLLPAIELLAGAGLAVAVAPLPESGPVGASIPAARYIAARAAAMPPESVRPMLSRYLAAIPSRSTRELYAADFRAKGLPA
jgi:hypothetical protein